MKVSLKFVPYVTLCTEPRSRERMHFAHLKVANGEIWIVSNVRCVHRGGGGWGGERKRNLHCKLYAAKTGNQPTRATILDTIIYPLNKRYQIIGGNLKSLIQMKTKNGVFFHPWTSESASILCFTHDLQLTYINNKHTQNNHFILICLICLPID